MYYTQFETQLCPMIIIGDERGIRQLHLYANEENQDFKISPEWIQSSEFFSDSIHQIKEYLNGNRRNFDVVLNPQGTDFQKSVWKELARIPYGTTKSYQEIAEQMNKGNACRAVGTANGKNPIPIIIPCHRVINKNGNLGGYIFGKEIKKSFLEIEVSHRLEK